MKDMLLFHDWAEARNYTYKGNKKAIRPTTTQREHAVSNDTNPMDFN